MNRTIAPNSHNRVVLSDIRRSDTDATPTTITSATASLLLKSTGAVVIAAQSASAVSGEAGTWAVTFTNTQCASIVVGTEYEVQWVYVADSMTRYQRDTYVGSYE